MEVINLNLRDQRYFAMNNLGEEFPGRTGTNKNSRAERRGREIVQLVQKQYLCPWKSIVVVFIFGADTLSDLVWYYKAAPNFIYVKKKGKKKNSNKHKRPVCLSKPKTV